MCHYSAAHMMSWFCVCIPSEFSRESLLDAGGLKCPLSKDKMDCSNSTDVADPTSRQSATQAGTVQSASSLEKVLKP